MVQRSGRPGPHGPGLPHHRTYGSVYGGSQGTLIPECSVCPVPLHAPSPYPQRFRRLLSGVAQASQPVCLRLWGNARSAQLGSLCSALPRGCRGYYGLC